VPVRALYLLLLSFSKKPWLQLANSHPNWSLSNRQLDVRWMLLGAINTWSSRLIIAFDGHHDIRKRSRVTIDQREPRALYLHHDTMAFPESMVSCSQVYCELIDLIWLTGSNDDSIEIFLVERLEPIINFQRPAKIRCIPPSDNIEGRYCNVGQVGQRATSLPISVISRVGHEIIPRRRNTM